MGKSGPRMKNIFVWHHVNMQHSSASTTIGLTMLSVICAQCFGSRRIDVSEPLCFIVIKGRETYIRSAVDVTDRGGRRSTSPREKSYFLELSRSRAYSSEVMFHQLVQRVLPDSSKALLYGMSSFPHSHIPSFPSQLPWPGTGRLSFYQGRVSETHSELPTKDDRDRFNHPGSTNWVEGVGGILSGAPWSEARSKWWKRAMEKCKEK